MLDNVIPFKTAPRMYVSMDGTGVPVVKRKTADRRGKDGGQAKTREAKLGCICYSDKPRPKWATYT